MTMLDAPGLDLEASLSFQVGRLTDAITAARAYDARCEAAIRSVPIQPHTVTVAGAAVTITAADNTLGPNTGYAWSVQRLVVAGLAAGTTYDTVSLYRGPAGAASIQQNNLLNVVTGNAPAWHPGRTGCMIFPGDTIIAAGTGLTATGPVTLTGEVILMELWLVPQFLM
jgi:hypothetical protein